MQSNIRDAAINLGNIDARPVTGHPFKVWHDRLMSGDLGKWLSIEHDPAKLSGWPLDEITIWVAVAPTPPIADWPDGCGEIGSFYMCSKQRKERRVAWEKAVVDLGYEIKRGVTLPERAAAIRAGLGVHGLNGLMITPDDGSFVDITVLMVHAAPPPDARGFEYDLSPGCGNCGDCIKACPTGAISENGVDTQKCLRNFMNAQQFMPEEYYSKMGRRILGCETCQIVCPKNAALKREQPPAEMTEYMKLENLLTEPDIESIAKYIALDENQTKMQAAFAAANTGRKNLLPLIEKLVGNENKTLDKIARWAVDYLREVRFINGVYYDEYIFSILKREYKMNYINPSAKPKLIIVAGMSGTGKSTTAQNISYQYRMNGIEHEWYHEEMEEHPIRWANGGEFTVGDLNTEDGIKLNIADIYTRWKTLIEYIKSKNNILVMDGCFDQNIIRYFYPGNYPNEKIIEFYDGLLEILQSANLHLIHLYTPDVAANYKKAFKVRGKKWEHIITDGKKDYDFADMIKYQELALKITGRYSGNKLCIDTSGDDWETYMKEICRFLDLQYYDKQYLFVANPEKYTGYFEYKDDKITESVNIICEDGELFCNPDWFTHIKMNEIGENKFELSAFPMIFEYQFIDNDVYITVSGNYDWGIVGKTLKRINK